MSIYIYVSQLYLLVYHYIYHIYINNYQYKHKSYIYIYIHINWWHYINWWHCFYFIAKKKTWPSPSGCPFRKKIRPPPRSAKALDASAVAPFKSLRGDAKKRTPRWERDVSWFLFYDFSWCVMIFSWLLMMFHDCSMRTSKCYDG